MTLFFADVSVTMDLFRSFVSADNTHSFVLVQGYLYLSPSAIYKRTVLKMSVVQVKRYICRVLADIGSKGCSSYTVGPTGFSL